MCFNTSWRSRVRIKFGSIGEIPPSTRGSFGFTDRMQSAVTFTMFEKICQPWSTSKSQWDLVFGSFQIMAASNDKQQLLECLRRKKLNRTVGGFQRPIFLAPADVPLAFR